MAIFTLATSATPQDSGSCNTILLILTSRREFSTNDVIFFWGVEFRYVAYKAIFELGEIFMKIEPVELLPLLISSNIKVVVIFFFLCW